ncbi:GTP pyrophosphokinase [Desulfoferrobacter suflitae]|uniref:GTP pyrophosphokinase n=1 Tax=Desulfoferrobacter suflitae TaxID=2865782 RepID=UPI0021649B94|nr:hypothetical protein [Desulfoferrobacter suflitae]MCK8600142.1 hypothetical protein [Desulfoferrobacter suflitae]
MNESVFTERFKRDEPMLQAWGEFVARAVCDKLNDAVEQPLEVFLKLPVRPRVKELESAIEKAFIRKGYENPYDDLTDKVGVRFVVLLTDEIQTVVELVESIPWWKAVKDRDYEEERNSRPEHFDYQSVHFIVRAAESIDHEGITIELGTPCEVQIRTLMQHAYSELTHDAIYKPKVAADPIVKRFIARSMALIETADDLFLQAKAKIKQVSPKDSGFLAGLRELYAQVLSAQPTGANKADLLIVDAYRRQIDDATMGRLKQFFDEKEHIVERIKDRMKRNNLFRHATILLVYYLVGTRERFAKGHWPLGSRERDLESVFSDLGKSYESD